MSYLLESSVVFRIEKPQIESAFLDAFLKVTGLIPRDWKAKHIQMGSAYPYHLTFENNVVVSLDTDEIIIRRPHIDLVSREEFKSYHTDTYSFEDQDSIQPMLERFSAIAAKANCSAIGINFSCVFLEENISLNKFVTVKPTGSLRATAAAWIDDSDEFLKIPVEIKAGRLTFKDEEESVPVVVLEVNYHSELQKGNEDIENSILDQLRSIVAKREEYYKKFIELQNATLTN